MGAIGGMLGLNGGSSGTGFSTPSGATAAQLNQSYGQVQGAMGNQNNLLSALQNQQGLQKQQDVYNQFQNVAAGQGPNPAQAMLNQATGQNVANQASLMAGQRGAGANVGLMARQNAMQGANLQQQAAGQGASMQAQQSLGAMGQTAGLANTMAGNQIGQTNANVTAQQNEQNILQNANTANNQIQGQLANTGMQGQQKTMGGLGNALGSVLHLGSGLFGAEGGEVPGYADGGPIQNQGSFGPQSMFAQTLMSSSNPSAPSFSAATPTNKNFKPYEAQKTPMGTESKSTMTSINGNKSTDLIKGSAVSGQDAFAGKDMPSIDPTREASAQGGNVGSKLKQGGHVPGQAKVSGNSYSNDTVKALLSPGEVVIPRSVMQSGDPIRGAASFVRDVMAKKGKRA